MNTFMLHIITPERQAFSEQVESVYVPSSDGQMGVLPHHEKLLASLVEGEIKIVKDKSEYFLAIGGGFMDIADNEVTILVSRAVHAHELNEQEIKKARESAEDILKGKAGDAERHEAAAMIRRAVIELSILNRHRMSRHH